MASIVQQLRATGNAIDGLLRHGSRQHDRPLHGKRALALFILCGGFYGAIMATFAFDTDRLPLIVFGMIKVPILFGCTMLLAIPSFYVMSALRGVAADFPEVRTLLFDYQLVIAITLAALAPITLLINISTSVDGYQAVQFWNTFIFFLAALTAQSKFNAQAKLLVARDTRHQLLLRVWTVLYAFVGIQMAWTLRPFIGSPDQKISFLREGKLENAYVRLYEIFSELAGSVF